MNIVLSFGLAAWCIDYDDILVTGFHETVKSDKQSTPYAPNAIAACFLTGDKDVMQYSLGPLCPPIKALDLLSLTMCNALPSSTFFCTAFHHPAQKDMADPFSIAGSAVGVISLGLVACEKLYTLIDDMRAAADKAEDIRTGLDRLEAHLEQLQTELTKLNTTSVVTSASASLVACAKVLNRFKDELPGPARADESKIHRHFQALRLRLSYSFKKGDLKYLRGLVQDVHQDLHTAQLTVLTEQGRCNTQMLESLISIQSQSIQSALADHHRNLESSVVSLHSLQARSIQHGFRNLDSEASLVRSDMSQMHALLQPLSQNSSQLSILQASLARMESKLDRLNPADSAVHIHRGDISEAQGLNRTLRRMQRKNNHLKHSTSTCDCRMRTSKTNFAWWSAVLSKSVTNTHDPDCPRGIFENRLTDIDVRISLCSSMLRSKFTLAVGISHSLAKGTTVRAGLRAINIVGYGSEAFSLIRSFSRATNIDLSRPDSWRTTAAELQKLFESRRASPHDRLSSGETLLHTFCKSQRFLNWKVNSLKKNFPEAQIMVENMRCMVGYLLGIVGATAQETDDDGFTCLQHCSSDTLWLPFLKQLFAHDIGISYDRALEASRITRLICQFDDDSLICTLDLPSIITIITQRDVERFSKALYQEQHIDSSDGYSCLYNWCAVFSWKEGCEVLLAQGIELSRFHSQFLFKYIIRDGDLDFLELWLNIRHSLSEANLECLGSLELALDQAIFHHTDSDPTWQKAHAIVTALEKQRRDLEAFAIEHLGEEHRSTDDGRLLDVEAWMIQESLKKKGVKVPPALETSRRCVYEFQEYFNDSLEVHILDALHEAGFRDLSGNDGTNGETPYLSPLFLYMARLINSFLWYNVPSKHHLRVLNWFLVRSKDIEEPWSNSHTKGIHLLAWVLGACSCNTDIYLHGRSSQDPCHLKNCGLTLLQGDGEDFSLWVPFGPTMETDPDELKQIRSHLVSSMNDSCECHCSLSGCVPLTIGSRSYITRLECHFLELTDAAIIGLAQHFVQDLLVDSRQRRIVTTAIRFLAFEKLEIRHTCCNLGDGMYNTSYELTHTCKPAPFYSAKDTRRIHREDQHLIQTLEKLVPELDQAYDDLGLSFGEFVETYMLPRIDEELERLAKEDEKFSEGRRALGVIMEPIPGHVSDEEVESGDEDEGTCHAGKESSDEEEYD